MKSNRAVNRADAGQALADRLLNSELLPQRMTIAGFWPIGTEIDLRPLLHALHGRGSAIVLPEVIEPGTALRFRIWRPDSIMLPGRHGTLHPAGPERRPDIVLAPLLAFDRQGGRLGWGGGYYDRTLAELRCRSIGCAYAAQEVAFVPMLRHDIRLDHVVTERAVIACRRR